jgi:hypothetical protein
MTVLDDVLARIAKVKKSGEGSAVAGDELLAGLAGPVERDAA